MLDSLRNILVAAAKPVQPTPTLWNVQRSALALHCLVASKLHRVPHRSYCKRLPPASQQLSFNQCHQCSSDLLELLDDETSRSIDDDVLAYGLDSSPLRYQDLGQCERLDGGHVQLRNTWQQPKQRTYCKCSRLQGCKAGCLDPTTHVLLFRLHLQREHRLRSHLVRRVLTKGTETLYCPLLVYCY